MIDPNKATSLVTSIKNLLMAAYPIVDRIDAELLLSHVIKQSRTWLYTHSEYILTESEFIQYQYLMQQRQLGMPIAYLTGMREFWSLPLNVNKDTLIPRPETELLVERTLDILHKKQHAKILELGTGSGAIAIALAYENPTWEIFACDISMSALEVAYQNAKNLNLQNIGFFCANWLDAIAMQEYFDAIVSNPPYLASDDPHQLMGDLRFEPHNALVSGVLGLDALAHIIARSKTYLKDNGVILLEHGYTQEKLVDALLQENGYVNPQCYTDVQGHPRVSVGFKNI